MNNPDFETWLRTECFQEPTKEAYELAKAAFKAGQSYQQKTILMAGPDGIKSSIVEVLMMQLGGIETGLVLVDNPRFEPVEMAFEMLEAERLEMPMSLSFIEKPPRRSGQKFNRWKKP